MTDSSYWQIQRAFPNEFQESPKCAGPSLGVVKPPGTNVLQGTACGLYPERDQDQRVLFSYRDAVMRETSCGSNCAAVGKGADGIGTLVTGAGDDVETGPLNHQDSKQRNPGQPLELRV